MGRKSKIFFIAASVVQALCLTTLFCLILSDRNKAMDDFLIGTVVGVGAGYACGYARRNDE